MPPKTIVCENRRGDGSPCGEAALVHMIHYIYDMKNHGDDTLHVLRGASYDIECPRCGRREQIVRRD
ncbi:MAG TPA: hypothetical protein VF175_19895 [Lacipirellula sp.]